MNRATPLTATNHRRLYAPVSRHAPITEQAMRNRAVREARAISLQQNGSVL